jgi:hypothetical protein
MTNRLTQEQQEVIQRIAAFVSGPEHCFILKGSAGTGKTTLIASLIQRLSQLHRSFCLLAPTGRAARILCAKTGTPAATIHRAIYSLSDVEVFEQAESANDPGLRMVFPLKRDDPGATLFIVDEASMVGDHQQVQDFLRFGSGRLLADLIEYARLGRPGRSQAGAKIVFVGDPAQLPPVGETLSPALSTTYLQDHFRLRCAEYELTEVLRQAAGSAILERATVLREAIRQQCFTTFACAPAGNEIVATSAPDAVQWVADSQHAGNGSSVLVTYSNARALDLNRVVRERLWGADNAGLQPGDLLLVNKNSLKMSLYNGDLVKVRAVLSPADQRKVPVKGSSPVPLTFRTVRLAYRNADGNIEESDCLLLENLLNSRERDLTPLEQRALLVDFRKRHESLRPGTADFKLAIRDDPFFNALQVKYGYAITCHKAQGGEWTTVVVDFNDDRGHRNEDYFRWVYTAITRARTQLFTINAPRFDALSDMRWATPATPPAPVITSPTDPVPPADPDWARYAFAAGQERLFAWHSQLRDAWRARDIGIVRLDHFQHCERYQVTRAGGQATVQYWYKANQHVSQVAPFAHDPGHEALAAEAVALMRACLLAGTVPINDPPAPADFIQDLQDRVRSALADTAIRLVGSQTLPYRLRLQFTMDGQPVTLDFLYNRKQVWTQVMEVGGPGASRGLIARLQQLLPG